MQEAIVNKFVELDVGQVVHTVTCIHTKLTLFTEIQVMQHIRYAWVGLSL